MKSLLQILLESLNEKKNDGAEKYNWDKKLHKDDKVKIISKKGWRFFAVKGKVTDVDKKGNVTIIDKKGKEFTRKSPMKLWVLKEDFSILDFLNDEIY